MTNVNVRPGTIVKDKKGQMNYGLPMNVISETNTEVMVGYINLDGNYKEGWLHRDQLIQVENAERINNRLQSPFI